MLMRSSHADLPPGILARLELVVSELASNAVVHAGTGFDIRLTIGSVIRLEVTDSSHAAPVLQRPSSRDLTGRGLRLVAASAERWGWNPTDDGKVVWAELDTQRQTDTT